MNSTDPRTRMDAMAKAQSIIEEDVVVIPIYEQGVIYLLTPKSGCSADGCGRRPRLHSRPGHP